MPNIYDEQISHMSHLMFFGENKENVKKNAGCIAENVKEGADGKIYGIVHEGTKYYIKTCEKGKENLSESFDYIGGWNNRKENEFSSFASAVKVMDMKLMSLNEDYHKKMPVNESKENKFEFMDDSMKEMKEDISRYSQILENIDQVYMNKKSGIGDRNIGVPEAPKTQEFNPKIGGPFEDTAKYEANRDNKENSKDHKSEGGPFEKDGTVDSKDMQSDKLETGKGDTVYDKKAEYVPDNAVAAMNPAGGKVVRVNESLEGEEPEGFEVSPEVEELSTDDILSKFDDNEAPEEGNDFWNEMDPEYARQHAPAESDGIAGIDDMSGVDRNSLSDGVIGGEDDSASDADVANLSADVVDKAVNEAYEKVSKRKSLDMLAESIAKKMIHEGALNTSKDAFYDPDDFEFHGPDYTGTNKQMKGTTTKYTGHQRVKNLHDEDGKKVYYDEDPKAPAWVTPSAKEYDKNNPNYGKDKYELDLNDDPNDNAPDAYKRTSAWSNNSEIVRKFLHYVSIAKAELIAKGEDGSIIDENKLVSLFEQSLYVLTSAEYMAARVLGTSPKMIENFLSANYRFGQASVEDEDGKELVYGDELNSSGIRDAKIAPTCLITPDGELPYTTENFELCKEKYGTAIVGPSLKGVGFMHSDGSDLTTDELIKLVDDADVWFREWEPQLEKTEENLKAYMSKMQNLLSSEYFSNSPAMRTVFNQFVNLAESFGPLMSLFIVPYEALNKREAYGDFKKYGKTADDQGFGAVGKGSIGGGLRAAKPGLSEEVTKLNDFGKHPGYRKKPMDHPEASEVAPNGARDWNDDSTKGNEPFGKQIGSSAPYTELVKTIANEVIKALQGGAKEDKK